MTMSTEPLNEKRLEDIRRGPGAYRIWSTDGQLLAACSSEADVKGALKHFCQGVSEGKAEPGVDTEAYRYIELGYAERYPVASLRFSYQLTPRAEAKAQRAQWLDEYEAEHPGQKPPLTTKR
jgi:hypothetical protein